MHDHLTYVFDNHPSAPCLSALYGAPEVYALEQALRCTTNPAGHPLDWDELNARTDHLTAVCTGCIDAKL